MLDVQADWRLLFKRAGMERVMGADGFAAEEPEDRLAAALERIARAVAADDTRVDAIAARLDALIETLQEALGQSSLGERALGP